VIETERRGSTRRLEFICKSTSNSPIAYGKMLIGEETWDVFASDLYANTVDGKICYSNFDYTFFTVPRKLLAKGLFVLYFFKRFIRL
jgi:hypothetical protein